MSPKILAAGPVFAGPATRPYRFVVCRWNNGNYTSHAQFMDIEGGFSDGTYFGVGKADYRAALSFWLHRNDTELERRRAFRAHRSDWLTATCPARTHRVGRQHDGPATEVGVSNV